MYPVVVSGNEDIGKQRTCYCNLPSCVPTGYLCKSSLGVCFTHLLPDLVRASHGCIETIEDRNQKTTCMNSPLSSAGWSVSGNANAGQATAAAGGSLVLCCFTDLCNHVDNPQSRLKLNDTIAGNWNGLQSVLGNNLGAAPGLGATSETNPTDVWFRAATIAVPICGAVILFLLIAIAVKILKTDSLEASNKLSATYAPHETAHRHLEQPLMKKSVSKRESYFIESQPAPAAAPLLLSHSNVVHECETSKESAQMKNEANAKMNSMTNSSGGDKEENLVIMQHFSQGVPQQSSLLLKPTNTDHNNTRNINVNIASSPLDNGDAQCANSKLYEKQFLPLNDKLYNKETIFHWGETGSSTNLCPR